MMDWRMMYEVITLLLLFVEYQQHKNCIMYELNETTIFTQQMCGSLTLFSLVTTRRRYQDLF